MMWDTPLYCSRLEHYGKVLEIVILPWPNGVERRDCIIMKLVGCKAQYSCVLHQSSGEVELDEVE